MSKSESGRAFIRAIACTFAVCASADLAAAQTPAPAPAQDSSKPSDAPSANKAASPTVITAHVAAPTEAVVAGPSAETIKAAKAAGYSVRGKGAKTHFCKSETQIGSHIPTDVCYNEDQFTQLQMRAEQQREQLKSAITNTGSSH